MTQRVDARTRSGNNGESIANSTRQRASDSFRIGKVRGDQRGDVWYLTYYEQGQRHRPRVGNDRNAAKQLAAQINGQLASHAPAVLSFQPVSIDDLRNRWLEHHEHVARSSVQTIRRYRAASEHLLRFVEAQRAPSSTGKFTVEHAELFVRYLRKVQVSPNGHPRSARRKLLDKGVRYILECCRTLFNYAARRRHLSPYAENPFAALDLGRIPLETSKPIVLFTPDEEGKFLEACDDWQFPVFLTLMLTGLRPGELTHLLLPNDIEWEAGLLHVANKPDLGWQVKTRNARSIPLVEPLLDVLRQVRGDRTAGPLFLRRSFIQQGHPLPDEGRSQSMLSEITRHVAVHSAKMGEPLSRDAHARVCRQVWRDAGIIKTERIRIEFIRVCRRIGLTSLTCPKMLRHLFATTLQDANVDPLVRNELMGHVASGQAGGGLAMTAVYTHTRPETKRQQLTAAMQQRPAWAVGEEWIRARRAAR